MAVEPGVLSQDMIYEAADLPKKSMPLDQIKFMGLSLQQFTDISLLTKCINIQIVTFRLCAFVSFPPELFQLHALQNIDLSGNSITTLPEPDSFKPLVKLRQLNLSDNNISNISEIPKLEKLTNLKHLILTGNICLSANDAFNQIVAFFPNLIVLNELIITSQHRGYIQNIAQFENQSTLPLSKIDDYFFLYVKYMHSSSGERYVRRSNAEFFCLSKVVRRFSAAEKIQSIFRGYLKRKHFKKMKSSAVFLQALIKYWFIRRMSAANKIQTCYLHFKLKQQIKRIVNARKIQSVWRRYQTRQECLISIFEVNQKISFYVSEKNLDIFHNFLKNNNFQLPDNEEKTKYRIIRSSEPKKQKLPGSPLVYYTIDKSAIIRPISHKPMTINSIWCGHDHNHNSLETRVSKDGVNWTSDCVMNSVHYRPYQFEIRSCKLPEYESLICCTYNDHKLFENIIRHLCANLPPGLRFFSEKSVKTAASYLIVQSSCRSFLVRFKHFRQIKKMALEKRAARTIKNFFHSTFFKSSINHSLDVLHYFRSLPSTTSYFITKTRLDQIFFSNFKTKYACKFGFSADRFVLIDPGTIQLPLLFVPAGKLVFALSDISALFKVGVSPVSALPSMIVGDITMKWLKRNRIIRLTFATPEEARIRIALFAYLTRDFTSIMKDTDVLPLCAANSIRNAWIGFSTRKTITHIGAQAGRKLNLQCLIKHNIAENIPKKIFDDAPKLKKAKKQDDDMKPEDIIAQLRGDYRPWHKNVVQYKELNPYVPANIKSQQHFDIQEETSQPPNQSMLGLGLVNDLANAFAQTNPIETGETSTKVTTGVIPKLHKRSPIAIKKPLVANVRFPKKKRTFEIEIETMTIYNPPLTQLKSKHRPGTVVQRSCPTKPVFAHTLPKNVESSDLITSTSISMVNNQPESDCCNTERSEDQKRASSTIVSNKPYATNVNKSPKTAMVPYREPQDILDKPDQLEKSDQNDKLDQLDKSDIKDKQDQGETVEEDDKKAQSKNKIQSKTLKKPLFNESDYLEKQKLKNFVSAQKTDNYIRELMQAAFTKLVRLRQIGIEIEQEAVVDNTIEQKRKFAEDTRMNLFELKRQSDYQNELAVNAIRSRSTIEKNDLYDTRTAQMEKATKDRNKKAQKMRNDHMNKVQKSTNEKKFAQAFVSMSRKVASFSEKAHREAENKKLFAQVAENAAATKSRAIESRNRFRSQLAEFQNSKLETAQWEKRLAEQRRDQMKTAHTIRLQKVADLMSESHQLRETIRMLKKHSKEVVYQPPKIEVIEDEHIGAAKAIDNFVGENCGLVESELLVEIIDQIISYDTY